MPTVKGNSAVQQKVPGRRRGDVSLAPGSTGRELGDSRLHGLVTARAGQAEGPGGVTELGAEPV